MMLEQAPLDVMNMLPQPPSKLELRYNRLYIVEWLFDDDRKTGSELKSFISQNRPGVDVRLFIAQSKDDVLESLKRIAREIQDEKSFPLLHIEAHGDKGGVGFHGPEFPGAVWPTDEDTLLFADISPILVSINRACNANLILFSAACWGVNALLAASEGPAPFMAVVGPTISTLPRPLLEATKEFYRHAFPVSGPPSSLDSIVDAASRELGTSGDLEVSLMVPLTYQALVNSLWSKCNPDVIRETALDLAKASYPGGIVDLGQLPYSRAIVALHQDQGRAARAVWGERLLLDTRPENLSRFDFDIEGMVRTILDERNKLG
jgi:hypothetical protein